jgi:hypothetical protein
MFSRKLFHAARVSAVGWALTVLGLGVFSGPAQAGAGAPAAIKRSQLTAPLGSTKGSFGDPPTAGHILPYVEQDN